MLGIGRNGPRWRAQAEAPGGPGDGRSGAAGQDAAGPDAVAIGRGAPGLGQGTPGAPGPGEWRPGPDLEARPADDAERDAWVVLAGVEGVGPVSFGRLVEVFGSATAVLRLALDPGSTADLAAATRDPDGGPSTLTPAAAVAIRAAAAHPERALEPVRRAGVRVITLDDERYPSRLRQIDLPPPVLFLAGDPAALDRPRAVAIVGTRRPTETGRATAGRIADGVAALGATVVSGLALGIDGAAHSAAVRAGTPTVAVIGGGHERLYPSAHRVLARSIADRGGAVLSEFPPDMQPSRGTFPRRNRIISGLADATVVVEAGARSGALTTAAWALEQGRALHIVPGRLDDPAVAGCLAFLREAGPEAMIVSGVPELLEDLGLLPVRGQGQALAGGLGATLTGTERAIAVRLLEGLGSVDELVRATGEGSATILGALTSLEVRGLVVEAYGRYRAAGALAAARTRAPVRVPAIGGRGRTRAA
jgi:DNA processing protein